jgi:hypothetical protein
VLEAQQLLAALLLGDVTADAAIAGKAPLGVEHRLAAHADVAPAAVAEVAPHEHFAERRPRLEQLAVRVPAALDLDAGFPALLAECLSGELLLAGRAGLDFDAAEAKLGVLLPIPVGRQAGQVGPSAGLPF